MSDIVKDLRSECYPEQYSGWISLCSGAADEIELLRGALQDIIQKADFHGNYAFSRIARRALEDKT